MAFNKEKKQDQFIINQKIKDSQLLVIDENGNKLGIISRQEALKLAQDKELDLVLIHQSNKPDQPSTAKILSYSKLLYDLSRKAKNSKKNAAVSKVKEIKLRPQVGDNDLNWMVNNAKKWLDDNCQVKLKILAFGRMQAKTELIEEVYNKFVNAISDKGKVQNPLKKLPNNVMYEALIVKK